MSDPDPRRRSPTARPPLPQPIDDLDERFAFPPAAIPSAVPLVPAVPNQVAGPFVPPGYPASVPQPMLPPGYPMVPGAWPQSFPPAQTLPQRPVLPVDSFLPPAAARVPSAPVPNIPVTKTVDPMLPVSSTPVPVLPAPSQPIPRQLAQPAPQTKPSPPRTTNPGMAQPTAAARARVPVVKAISSTNTTADSPVHDRSDPRPVDFTKFASQLAPPWLISMVVHLVLLMSLALIQLSEVTYPTVSIEASYADAAGEQMLDDSILATALETMDNVEAAVSKDTNPVDNPLAAMPRLDIVLDAPGSSVNLEAPSIGMALTGREKGAKEALLSAYGGTGQTEGAVGLALDWLRKQQQRDGTWSLMGPFTEGVTIENKTAATAMALLALQGNGHSHQKGAHREAVSKGLTALLKMQDKDGNFVHEGVSGHRLYAQAIASIVVCELYGMTKDPEVKPAAELALDYAAKIQADDGQGGGGWRYHPGQDVDTSVTGWFVMAFQSGRMAGLDSHSQTLQRVAEFLNHVEKMEREFDGSVKDISYCYRIDESPRLSMTAEALLCRQYLGWDRTEPRLQAGVKKFLLPANRIKWEEPQLYYWYYATQVMHHMGGNEWHEWNQVMRDVLPKAQEKGGRERGSWSPAGDPHGYQGGRLYSTCFCVFMLESYYRHLPLYRHGS